MDALIGISPDDMDTVKVGDGEIDISPIPATKWARLTTELAVARQNSARRQIKRLTTEGVDVNALHEEANKLGHVGMTNLDMAVGGDPEYIEEMVSIQVRGALLSVVAMRNIKTRQGAEIPCTRDAAQLTGPAAKFFEYNQKLVLSIWPSIQKLNTLEVSAKKA